MAKKLVRYLFKNLIVVLGLVLMWRGVWYVLDAFDKWLFGGSHFWTGLLGIFLGLLVLYLPDKKLDEIKKL